ncbi:MAG: prepilin-type N-terminal cleavage/methylation protein [Planctomycetota bacterium]|nr:prepilin-type N-terminal cleavage/methylation protein [Planctomycetota bacterium]
MAFSGDFLMIAARGDDRRGVTLVEVLIVMAVIFFVLLLALTALPRSRETARLASCGLNLSQIGKALAYYDGAVGHLPRVAPPGTNGPGPLGAVLGLFGLDDLKNLEKSGSPPSAVGRGAPSEHVVRGFLCPSDSNARNSTFPAPVNYRANTGSGTDGRDGPFAIGGAPKVAEAEAAGKDFTAAFSERLVGSGPREFSPINDYQVVAGPLGQEPCPPDSPSARRRDAGSSWARADWTSSLYNHAMTPNASPSCIASDDLTARMGASSAHTLRVNVLMLGGSVRGFTPRVDPKVWRNFGPISVKERD